MSGFLAKLSWQISQYICGTDSSKVEVLLLSVEEVFFCCINSVNGCISEELLGVARGVCYGFICLVVVPDQASKSPNISEDEGLAIWKVVSFWSGWCSANSGCAIWHSWISLWISLVCVSFIFGISINSFTISWNIFPSCLSSNWSSIKSVDKLY